MRLKKKLCRDWKLYVITEPPVPGGRPLTETVRLALEGGASVVQLRDKEASDRELERQALALLQITRLWGIPLIVNDRVKVALSAGADGVHLGQNDGSLKEARRVLGATAIIGRSTHSREQALAALEEGADYIGVGPVFQTPTKPDYNPVGLDLVAFAAKRIKVPFVAIGGIDENNIEQVRLAGARTVAVVRAVIRASNPKETAQNLCRIMNQSGSVDES